MALNSPLSSQELNHLSDILTEALDIEKCSICLENINDAVLLWPCTHWFCKDCIARMHQSDQTDGRKMSCPLCKKCAARRKVLSFDDQQKEYANCLQSLIGALSLDLGFDITSYKKQEQNFISKTKITRLEPSKNTNSSPVRKTKRLITKSSLPDQSKTNSNKRITRKSINTLPLKNETLKPMVLSSPPKTPDSSVTKEIKVKKWLDSTRFSEAEGSCSENVIVVDVHKPETYSLVSEEQLQSVTQLDSNPTKTPFTRKMRKRPNTPSDIDSIRPFDTSTPIKLVSKTNKDISIVDQFDELISEKRKFQTIKTTYGENISTRKRRRIVVESDIFKSVETTKKDSDLEDSQKSLEDFSSGSGEEWSMEKSMGNKMNSLINKRKVTPKKTGKETRGKKTTVNAKRRNMKCPLEKSSKSKHEIQNSISNLERTERRTEKLPNKNNLRIENSLENIAKRISADWDDSVDVVEQSKPCNKSIEHYVFKESINPTVNFKPLKKPLTPKKEAKHQRSPGWSRLKSTKKEFHMSEKKKLSLKTLNKSKSPSNVELGIKPLSKVTKEDDLKLEINNRSFNIKNKVDMNESAFQIKVVLDEPQGEETSFFQTSIKENVKAVETPFDVPKKSILSSFNKSVSSSSSDSPFKGFESLEVRKEIGKSSKFQHCALGEVLSKEKSSFQSNLKTAPVENIAKGQQKSILGNFNKSISSSSSGSPFKGFESPEVGKEKSTQLLDHVVNKIVPTNILCRKEILDNKSIYQEEKTMLNNKSEIPVVYTSPCKADNVEKNASSSTVINGQEDNFSHTNYIDKISSKSAQVESEEGSNIKNRKRDRDSGIHDISSPCSPVRKKMLIDAEVQTSPSQEQVFIKQMVQSIWGSEVSNMLDQAITVHTNVGPIYQVAQTPEFNKATNNKTPKPDQAFVSCSQDSDKENVFIPNQSSNITEKFLNDSDIVMGTEELAVLQRRENFAKNNCNPKKGTNTPNTHDEKNPILLSEKNFDHDGPTQPNYKTPLVPKQTLSTPGGILYSVISNPTESELKKADMVFQHEEVLFPAETPKTHSLWHDSGIDQLVELSEMKDDQEDEVPATHSSTLTLKEKSNRSRRQLDFIGEDSNDMFEAGKENLKHQMDDEENVALKKVCIVENEDDCEKNDDVVKTHKMTSEENSFGLEDEVCSANIIAGTPENNISKVTRVIEIVDRVDAPSDSGVIPETNPTVEETPQVLDNPDNSNQGSEDSIIEGTPDNSQADLRPGDGAFDQGDPNPPEPIQTDDIHTDNIPENSSNLGHIQIEKIENHTSPRNVHSLSEQLLEKRQEKVDESEDQEEEPSCFASSLLTPHQNQMLKVMCAQFNIQFSKSVGPHISHLIVGTKDGRAQNTYKFLLAMALHKPIVRFEWVEEVMRIGKALPLDPFIALDSSGECGVLRAYLDNKRELLNHFAIHVFNTVDAVVQRDQIEELIRLCGGLVVTRLDQFHMIPRDRFRVIVLSDALETQPGWREQYSAAEVSIDWIYNSIGRYRVVPLPRFMDDSTDIIPFLLRQGYPPELIEETESQKHISL